MKSSLFLLFLIFSMGISSFTQENPANNLLDKFDVELFAGPNLVYGTGSLPNELKDLVKFFKTEEPEHTSFKGGRRVLFIPNGGLLASYPLLDELDIGIGLEGEGFGYKFAITSEFRDPDFQYNEYSKEIRKLTVYTLGIPFQIETDVLPQFQLVAGAKINFPLNSTAQSELELKTTTLINGEEAPELFSQYREKNDIEEQIQTLFFTYYFGARIMSFSRFTLLGLIRYTEPFYQNNVQETLSNVALSLRVTYKILSPNNSQP